MQYKLQPTPSITPTILQDTLKPKKTSQPTQLSEPTKWRSPDPDHSINHPSSGSQLYSQRTNAIQKGQLYTRLKANSYETA